MKNLRENSERTVVAQSVRPPVRAEESEPGLFGAHIRRRTGLIRLMCAGLVMVQENGSCHIFDEGMARPNCTALTQSLIRLRFQSNESDSQFQDRAQGTSPPHH